MEKDIRKTGFYNFAYKKRGQSVKDLAAGKIPSHEKMFLSFMSHNPIFISNGPKGLNGSVKGVGFLPKEEFLEEALVGYKEHIKSFSKEDKNYSIRGLDVLIKYLYSEEAEKNIDFRYLYGVEMAYNNSYANYLENSEATLLFYKPPMLSFEVRGKMELIGTRYDKDADVKPEDLPILQQFVNAQHDVYHYPNMEGWKTRLVYRFKIEEIFDKSASPNGWGKKIF